MGKEELKEHRSKEQTKAVVRAVKSKGNLTLAALLFSGISVISEGLQFQESFQELQQQCLVDFQEAFFSMSAYEQDSMCSDTSACALGTCVGTVEVTECAKEQRIPRCFHSSKD